MPLAGGGGMSLWHSGAKGWHSGAKGWHSKAKGWQSGPKGCHSGARDGTPGPGARDGTLGQGMALRGQWLVASSCPTDPKGRIY